MKQPTHNRKKMTIEIDPEQLWYLKEIAHESRMTMREALYHVIERYMSEYPLVDRAMPR